MRPISCCDLPGAARATPCFVSPHHEHDQHEADRTADDDVSKANVADPDNERALAVGQRALSRADRPGRGRAVASRASAQTSAARQGRRPITGGRPPPRTS